MSLVDINFDSFSSAKLYQQRISRLHVVMKKIYNFPAIFKTRNGESGNGNGERGTGNGVRGTGNGERGTGNL